MRAIAWASVAAMTMAAGCGGEGGGCDVVCAKNVECQADAPPEAECTSICEELSKDEGYAEAIEEQAECYEGRTCASIDSGACNPDFS